MGVNQPEPSFSVLSSIPAVAPELNGNRTEFLKVLIDPKAGEAGGVCATPLLLLESGSRGVTAATATAAAQEAPYDSLL